METVDADRHLLSGQFHKSGTERDHLSTASPRSLIFDTPSIFPHRHAPGRGQLTGQRATQQPMTEVISEEGKKEEEPGAGKEHGAKASAGGHGATAGGTARKESIRKPTVEAGPGADGGSGEEEGEGQAGPGKKEEPGAANR